MSARAGLIVRVDARHETGLGHAVRTSRLLAALEPDLAVTVVGDGEALNALFPDAARRSAEKDAAAAVLAAAKDTGAAALLMDEPAPDPAVWAALDALPQIHRVMIDDFGADVAADLVINGTVIDAYHRYPNLRPGGEALCGPRYTLISPAFAAARHDRPRTGPVIAVCGGGARAARWALQLAEHGPRLAGAHDFHLVVGAAYPDFETLKALAARSGATLERGLTADALAARLAAAPLALTTGGMIAYEVLAAGVPALVFPQLDNLKHEIAWFAGRVGLIDLGFETGDALDQLEAKLAHVLDQPDLAHRLSETGPQLVDGLGLARAARALEARLASVELQARAREDGA